jgi:Domain of unknown function (DUF5658)
MSPLDLGTPGQYRWLAWIVAAVLLLNLCDAVFTLFWVHAGMADEGNLLLRELVYDHPLLFVAAKMTLVALGAALLWMRRHRAAAVVAIFGVFLVYYVLLLYHLGFVGRLL